MFQDLAGVRIDRSRLENREQEKTEREGIGWLGAGSEVKRPIPEDVRRVKRKREDQPSTAQDDDGDDVDSKYQRKVSFKSNSFIHAFSFTTFFSPAISTSSSTHWDQYNNPPRESSI